MDELGAAIYRADEQAVSKLLEAGAKTDVVDRGGRTPLMNAVLSKKIAIVRLLLENGADPNLRDKLGATALHFAAQDFQLEALALLLRAGAAVDPQDAHGNTPLWRAVMKSRGRGEIIRSLLSAGADPSLKNKEGRSPKELAHTIDNYDLKAFFAPSRPAR